MSVSVWTAGGPAQSDSNEPTAQCSGAAQSEKGSRVQPASALSHALMRCDHELAGASFPAPLVQTAFIISGPLFVLRSQQLSLFFSKRE